MSFQERNKKHKPAIQKRWLPIQKEFLLKEEPEEKISILKKAKQQAAKGIQDQDELLAFLEYLDGELKWYLGSLNQNDSANAQGPVQRNETLNTGEPVEKINWQGTETQLVFLMELLTQEGFLKSGRHWKMVEEHFLVKGKLLKPKQLSQTYQNLPVKGPRKAQILESILSQVSSLED